MGELLINKLNNINNSYNSKNDIINQEKYNVNKFNNNEDKLLLNKSQNIQNIYNSEKENNIL